ncbi:MULTISPECIES: porin [unclassified Undibacterium]|uniref:porin n=1 Tax=unclassified Undibacterium TaxID=2630295 RepID=UPI002AC99D94|nr:MULTISPECIES: porin [unclassified Undibacterium]MEB0139874.1 porin [Undibacterium sp. CCC2.1]MEB0171857.1 porin [Undibacterium sp. CCC1.1]MEB0175673.1 porin [Undibacterium sp. CCC3.4]MEB0217281.1 porin [Undibacterium sp. 5I2]WPX44147.1 porin [Undibacterium sp. CCC3.4]
MKIKFNPRVVFSILASALTMTAHAQSQVEIYGLVGAYAGSMKRSGDTAAVPQLNGGGLTTSYLGFRGKEDLGGNVSAIFSLESFFRTDTGEQGRSATDPLFSRNAWVGMEGDFGRVTMGRQTNPAYSAMSQLSPFGTSVVFSPLVLQTFVATYGSNVLGDTVWNNVLQYSAPKLSGFSGTVQYGFGEVAGSNGVANLGLHGSYTDGKFFAAVSAQRLRVNVLTPLAAQQKAVLAGVSYDFGLLKLSGNLSHTDIDKGRSTRTVDAGISLPISAVGSILAETAQSHIATPGVADLSRTTSSFGYDHKFSKRTDVYIVYSLDKRSNAASAGSQAIGLRHAF